MVMVVLILFMPVHLIFLLIFMQILLHMLVSVMIVVMAVIMMMMVVTSMLVCQVYAQWRTYDSKKYKFLASHTTKI